HISRNSLRDSLIHRDLSGRFLSSVGRSVALGDAVVGSSLDAPSAGMRGRSILIAVRDQLTAAMAILQVDGVARRIVLCPADLAEEYLPFIIATASVDTIITDGSIPAAESTPGVSLVTCDAELRQERPGTESSHPTEWILLTSGTTGIPKLVVHTLDSLAGAINPSSASSDPIIWSTFYDIRRYGGLQIFLRALLTGSSLVLSDGHEPASDFLTRAGKSGVTHISGTPSHWRRALMNTPPEAFKPLYIRLSGEIADQGILDNLRLRFPAARIVHAFASTEAGLAFEVHDGRAGFPASLIGSQSDVEIKIQEDALRVRSRRTAARYLGDHVPAVLDQNGFVDTHDVVSLREDRYYFAGRRDGVINVGGLKVYPEEIESVLNIHPLVEASMVRSRKNPVTGALVTADIVLKDHAVPRNGDVPMLSEQILQFCRDSLPSHKVPAIIKFVSALGIAGTGKLMRSHA
ncbi:MAG TPA: long-chain fatty acid--CoA ligase, partial [Bryobacteraceae bacterium]|nr:long-chain fatty acid--CoA ligase [Bryobacteraceae bacterium]